MKTKILIYTVIITSYLFFTLNLLKAQQTNITGASGSNSFGSSVITLPNGNYVVTDPLWGISATKTYGAVSLYNGKTNTLISTLKGSTLNDNVGSGGIIILSNGNFLIYSPKWQNVSGIIGAVTWCDANNGVNGNISSANSLIGSRPNDAIGSGGIIPTSNGNYIVISPNCDLGSVADAGAVTWGNGNTGTKGAVNSSNSLMGSTAGDFIGLDGVTVLENGNYIVKSSKWSNGSAAAAGAVTWGNGNTGVSGTVSSSNSLVGSNMNDNVGSYGVVELTNGNYVVNSPLWNNGSTTSVGAVTWGNGNTGIKGLVSSSNSLIGNRPYDGVGMNGVTALTNGNYVVNSINWDNGSNSNVGAVTWGNGNTGTKGSVNSSNSFIGKYTNDLVGDGGITALSNGNYIIYSKRCENTTGVTLAGAVTLGNGSSGISGMISTCNSVFGNSANNGNNMVFTYNEVNGNLVVGRPSENIVSVFKPTGMSMSNTGDVATANILGTNNVPLTTSTCRIIASITPNGASAVSGNVSGKVWIENTQPAQWVKRHYEITPATNAANATARVTLYFTQAEFDDFNLLNAVKLPTNSSDNTGIANLLIEKKQGTSSDGTGLPATYSGSVETIDPADNDIVWNSEISRWEVSFNTTGFSGFFVKTESAVLSLTLLNFEGNRNNNTNNLVWKTANEIKVKGFELQRSNNAAEFSTITNITAKNGAMQSYNYNDNISINNKIYYRLKMIDEDRSYRYSKIVMLKDNKISTTNISPNPAKNFITITTEDKNLLNTEVLFMDSKGAAVLNQKLSSLTQQINIASLPQGLYFLKFSDATVLKLIKE